MNEVQQNILKIIEDILKEHPKSYYVTDEAIANSLGVELQLARDYLELTQRNDYIEVVKTHDGWSAGLTAKGRITLQSSSTLQLEPQGTDISSLEKNDVQSKVSTLNALLQRTYDLVKYARSKQNSAPIALADRRHPNHVENDRYFCEQREQLLSDIKGLLETGWDPFEYNRLQSQLEHFPRSVLPGNAPGWKGLLRCRCWWDARDELQEMANYLHNLKAHLNTASDEEMTTQIPSREKQTSKPSPWLSGFFYLTASVVAVTLFIIAFKTVGIIGLPIVIIGTLLLVSIIGAFQLRQDEALNQENFLSLMLMVYRQIPFLLKRDESQGANGEEHNAAK